MTREIDPLAERETLMRLKIMLLLAESDLVGDDDVAALQEDVEMIDALIQRAEQRAANLADGLRH
jgi:hypothetical protein